MATIGVTGGICTGKSSFTNCLRELLPQAMFFDADEMARELTRTDADVIAALRAKFGAAIFHENGQLNRSALRAIVFAAPEKRRELESILHPRIRAHWSGEAIRHRNSTFIADIPLLYETGGETLCDRVVVVACTPRMQLARLLTRTGMEAAEADRIIAAQMPSSEKIRRADHVVWNNGSPESLREQARLLAGLLT